MPDNTVHFGVQIEQMRLQIRALEAIVARLPGVSDIDFKEIEEGLLSSLPAPLIENVSHEAQGRWARTAVQRISSIAAKEPPQPFD